MPSPVATHFAQIAAILRAWGMSEPRAAETAEILGYADLHGIDSHGLSMIPPYDIWRRNGQVNITAVPSLVLETPVSAVIDAGGGLGHVPGALAMRTAIAKAKAVGMAAAVVRHTSHFGALGYYGTMAAEAGLIGFITTSAAGVRVLPTGGAEPRLGTDPWCMVAPGEPGRPFMLDMATTTVAYGRVRNKTSEGQPTPPGWVLDASGTPSTDPRDLTDRGGFLTSLGGPAESSGYKGYGLAMMANILSAGLAGGSFPSDPTHSANQPLNLAHFFMAMDPAIFRDPAEFRSEVARFSDAMRATPPRDPARPVLVAGDPERATAARRRVEGIPVGEGLKAQVRAIADAAGAEWLLG